MSECRPCDTCAFGKKGGAGAASEPHNRLVATICANAAIPFHCHEKRDGSHWNWKGGAVEFMNLPAADKKLCAGWQREVAARKAMGHFNVGDTPADQSLLRRYQRGLGAQALKALDYFLAEKDPKDKADFLSELEDLCRALAPQRDIGRE